jgi:hypothetical protein
VRTEKGPRQRLILNLGNLHPYPTQYKAFAKRVEDILTGQRSFIELDTGLEKQAHAAAEKIFRKQAREIGEEAETDYRSVDVNSLESQTHRSIGSEYVCHGIWEELGLNEFFVTRGITRNVLPLVEALVVGRLKEKYPKASKLYRVEVIPEEGKAADDPSLVAVDIVWKQKAGLYEEETGREGSYVLRTDRVDLSDKEIWETYNMLRQIEYAFKSMKSSLGLRPNFHQVEGRVDTHMFISVLAYHLLHIIEYRLRQKGDHRRWDTIRNILKTHERLTIGYKRKDEDGTIRQQYVRINSTVEPEHMEIYRKLGLSGMPLPRKRIAVNQ